MKLRLPNTPMNRGASEQIYSRGYMAVCASVCVQCMDRNRGHCPTVLRPSIAELWVTCVDVVKKKKEKVNIEDIVSCHLSTL